MRATKAAEFAVDDDPRVVEAREARERAERHRDDALEALLEAEEGLDAAEDAEAEGEGDPAHRRRLVQKLPGLKSDLRVAEKSLEVARRREQEAFREAVLELKEDMEAAYAEAVRELHRRLLAAGEANEEVRDLYRRGQELSGAAGFGANSGRGVFGTMHQAFWPQLSLKPSATQGGVTKIGTWERFLERNLGLEFEDAVHRRNGKSS